MHDSGDRPPAYPYPLHPQVYPPEADTYLLLRAALAEVREGDRVCEVGTGSGLIAGELSRTAPLVATEINPHAIAAARRLGVEVIRTDLLAGVAGPFDLVLFNPPYLPTEPDERLDDWLEYALDGGETGREVAVRFIRDVGRVLSPAGRVLLLVSTLTGIGEVQKACADAGFIVFMVAGEECEGERLMVLRLMRDLCRAGESGSGGWRCGEQR
ncbi:MAG: methyltransferase [Methanomicrobiales archaeon]|nr:methyltransferase [Methanomicrobiales archaeon]